MSPLPLRQCLILEIQETVNKNGYMYQNVDLCKMFEAIKKGSYELSPLQVKSVPKGFPFEADRLFFGWIIAI